jgi:hypothetical protein
VRERATDGPLTLDDLEDYSQLWLFGTDRDIGTALAFDEVRAIRDFLETGAGLLVAGEHEDESTSYADDVALVSELYGVAFEESAREAADGELVPLGGVDGALLPGVAEVPGFASVAELGVTDPAVRVAGTVAGKPALAYRDDGPWVVFDRSWEGWSDAHRGAGDQPAVVSGVATFLEGCAR